MIAVPLLLRSGRITALATAAALLVLAYFLRGPSGQDCAALRARMIVPSFGYNDARTLSVESCLDARAARALQPRRLEGTEGATLAQPIFVPGSEGPDLFHLSSQGASFRDPDSGRLKRQISFQLPPASWNNSAPVYVAKHRRIYGVYFHHQGQRLTHVVYSISLDASMSVTERVLPTREVFGRALTDSMVFCRTASAFASSAEGDRLVFGCSLNRGANPNRAATYAERPGIRGGLVSVSIDSRGDLATDLRGVRVFFPAKLTKDPLSGRDASIWMSGAAPAVLGDGTLLFTTGNGRIAPEAEQFGCALLALGPQGQTPRSFIPYAESSEGPRGRKLCEHDDADLSSSGVTVASLAIGESWVGLNAKDGTFRALKLTELDAPGSRRYLRVRLSDLSGVTFGQPAVWAQDERRIAWVMGSMTGAGWRYQRWDLESESGRFGKAWESSGAGAPHRSSPSITWLAGGKPGLVFFSVTPRAASEDESELVVLTLQGGKTVARIPYKGRSQFTAPVVFADAVYLATSQGIVRFR
jgi:hypothetical protein